MTIKVITKDQEGIKRTHYQLVSFLRQSQDCAVSSEESGSEDQEAKVCEKIDDYTQLSCRLSFAENFIKVDYQVGSGL